MTVNINANKLTVNMKNTHYMIFHRAKLKTTGQDVVMQNCALTCVTTTKFLGVIQHSPTLNRWLGIIYLVKFQPMCLIYVLKTLPNYMNSLIIYHKLD